MTSFVSSVAQRPSAIPSSETIRWSGTAGGGLVLDGSDVYVLVMGLGVVAFGAFWTSLAMRAGGLFALWGVLFIGVALWQAVGRLGWDAYLRSRTMYYVTDCAAYIVAGSSVQRYSGFQLDNIRIDRGATRSTIRFGPEPQPPPWWARGRGYWPPSKRAGFVRIADLDGAYDAILAAQKGPS